MDKTKVNQSNKEQNSKKPADPEKHPESWEVQVGRLNRELESYRKIFERSKDALLILRNREFIDCNDAALHILGYDRKELFLNAKPSELSPPLQPDGKESFEKAQEMMNLAVEQGSHRFEWNHKRADGTVFPVEVLLTIISTEPGNEMIYTTWRDITEKKIAQQTILESETRFRSLVHQSPFVIELYDLEGLQIDVNKAYEVMWGFPAETTLKKFNILKSEEVRKSGLLPYVQRAYEGDAVVVPVYQFDPTGATEANGPGRVRWLSTKIYPLKDNRGKVSNIVITHEDVSDRKKASDDLRFSEERFRSLVETTRDFIWEVDTEGRYLYASPQVKNLLGYEPEEMLGKTPFDFMPEPENRQIRETFKKISSRNLFIENMENLNIHKDGHQIVLETNGVPFYDTHGNFAGYRGIDRDITTRKIYEEQLILTESVFRNSIEGIAITDREGSIQKVNKAFTDITGYTSDDVLGKNPRVLKSDRHEEAFYKKMWTDLLEIGQWSGEIWNRKKDGVAYPEWLSISAIRDDQGNITNFISVFHDISEKKINEEKMEFLAFHDPLTKLPNRRLFYDRLHVAIESANRSGQLVALLYMDIDNFKDINDTHGHPFGDELLCKVKERIANICRKSDTFARYGGDEFAIILNGIHSGKEATDFSNRLVGLFKEPLEVFDELIYTSLSVGVTIFPQDGEDIVTLEKNADLALYKAKKDGKRQTYQFQKELQENMERKTNLINGLRKAMTDFSSFSIHFQPKIDTRHNRIYGVEALVRWTLEGQPVSPGIFIPLAEETNLIIPLGNWIIRQSMAEMKQIHSAGFDDIILSINLSTRQFVDERLFDTIEQALEETGFDGSKLIFEITESTSMNDVEQAVTIMEKFKERRLPLSMDDFGTGYSSLSYLKQFPLQELKIDRSFIMDLPADQNDVAICKTIISMAKSLNYIVVAEGVENESQMDFLKEQGCFVIQGYVFFKPMEAERLLPAIQDFYASPGA